MINVSKPIINNYKIGFAFDSSCLQVSVLKSCLERKKITTKHYHNFSIVRHLYVFSIFWESGYVNVTKIRKASDIKKAVSTFFRLCDIQSHSIVKHPEIHNICASGSFSQTLNLLTIKEKFLEKTSFRAWRNLSNFPALFINVTNLGTVVLFQNGKYSLVGVNSETNITLLIEKLHGIITS